MLLTSWRRRRYLLMKGQSSALVFFSFPEIDAVIIIIGKGKWLFVIIFTTFHPGEITDHNGKIAYYYTPIYRPVLLSLLFFFETNGSIVIITISKPIIENDVITEEETKRDPTNPRRRRYMANPFGLFYYLYKREKDDDDVYSHNNGKRRRRRATDEFFYEMQGPNYFSSSSTWLHPTGELIAPRLLTGRAHPGGGFFLKGLARAWCSAKNE